MYSPAFYIEDMSEAYIDCMDDTARIDMAARKIIVITRIAPRWRDCEMCVAMFILIPHRIQAANVLDADRGRNDAAVKTVLRGIRNRVTQRVGLVVLVAHVDFTGTHQEADACTDDILQFEDVGIRARPSCSSLSP